MSAETELPLPGEGGFKYPDKPETLGALWDALKIDAQTVTDATGPVKASATAIQGGNTGRTAEASTRVVNFVSGNIDGAAQRLRWFERPITDYLAVLAGVKTPINTLRDKWREGEADLRRLQNQEAIYVTDEPVSYAEKWAARQTELRNAYNRIITETVDPGKNAFIAGLQAIAEDREPPASVPVSIPPLPEFVRLPGVYPLQPGQQPPTVDPNPGDGGNGNDNGGNGNGGNGNGNGGNGNGNANGSGTGDPDPQPEPEPQPEPQPEPEPGDPTPSEILTEWFADHPTDGAATAAAWLLLPIGAATYAGWAASPAGRTSMATWLVRPRQQAVYDAFVQTPEAKQNLTAWIQEHGGLEDGAPPPADPVAWINDPAHAAQRSQWLADPATREVIADWVSDPANAAHRTAWLSDPKTQNGLVGWMRDPATPANGQAFAEWTKHPTDVTPLPPPPPEPVDPPASGVRDPGTTGVPPTTTDVDDPATVPTPV